MRYLAVLLALGACADGPLTTAGPNTWNTCVNDKAFIGYRIQHADGRIGTVKTIFGRSDRCSVTTHPVLAAVEYDPLPGQSNVKVWEQK